MVKKLVIFGAGDFGREIMYAARESKEEIFETIAFVVDEHVGSQIGGKLEGIEIISLNDATKRLDDETYFIIGIGNAPVRKKVFEEISVVAPGAKFATIVHNSAVIMPNVVIEEGVFVGTHTTVAVGSHLKRHSAINQNVSIGHDTVVGEYSVVSPGCVLSGRTKIGCTSFLGSNVVTYPKVSIGSFCSVSASTVVARNLKDKNKLILRQSAMALPNG